MQEIVQVFREIRRVLRKDGTVWLNLGDKYAGSGCGGASGATTLEGSTESQDQSKIRRARAPEEIGASARSAAVTNRGRRALREGLKEDRQGSPKERPWRNVQVTPGFRDKQRLMLPARVALALQDDGWFLRDEIIWFKTNPMPSSVTDRTTPAHEMVYLLTRSQGYFFDATAIAEPSNWDPKNTKNPDGWDTGPGAHGSVHRIWREKGRVTRSGNKARKTGEERGRPNSHLGASVPWEGNTRNKRSVWSIATEPFPEAHFATFPTGLVEPCILAGTSERGACVACGAPWERIVAPEYDAGNRTTNGPRSRERKRESAGYDVRMQRRTITIGWYPTCRCDGVAKIPPRPPVKERVKRAAWVKAAEALCEQAKSIRTKPCVVLDPFGGAGTTALVADRHQRDAILIELNGDYVAMAKRRLKADLPIFHAAE